MLNNLCHVRVAVDHEIGNALALVAVYAEQLGGIALLVIVHYQHELAMLFSQNVSHADGAERLGNAAFQIDDRYRFHFVFPLK